MHEIIQPEIPVHSDAAEALQLMRWMLQDIIKPERLSIMISKSYLSIRVDGNNRRSVCRLYLDKKYKYIGVITERKVETRHKINSIRELSEFKNDFRECVLAYQRLVG